MARHGNYLYRRNGHFYARLRVPQTLEGAFGKSHLRASLNTSDYSEARLRVLETILAWKRSFLRVSAMLNTHQLLAGSALLSGDGLLSIDSAARECGLQVEEMLREVINRAVALRIEAMGWHGSDVPIGELQTDYDGAALPDDTLLNRDTGAIVGALYVRHGTLRLVQDGQFSDCVFFRDAACLRAVVLPYPGVTVKVGSMLIEKAAAEAIRAGLAANITPAMLTAYERSHTNQPTTVAPAHKHGNMCASSLMKEFFTAKSPGWSEATKIQMTGMCGVFIELMVDPILAEIDGVTMLRYREQLLTLPTDLYQNRRRLKVKTLVELAIAAAHLPKMSLARADAYVAKIGEMFAWGSRKGFMPDNPAAGAVERKKKTKREQDDRNQFSNETLIQIFSASWFTTGKGEKNARGEQRNFQPHHYWMPLLGLYGGGRLNELSQLYLSDIPRTALGTIYLDFNLEGEGKIEETEKRLKTVNSMRKVPLHPELVRLGLPEYVNALRSAGYDRLFPELSFDRVKGYGKQAGKWFNEKYLGKQLKIPRDGMQTFHSFRHNFVTGLNGLQPPPAESTINQLSGHQRGETMSGTRYNKDKGPDFLNSYVSNLKFNIPTVKPFDIDQGLQAVKDALKRKIKPRLKASINL